MLEENDIVVGGIYVSDEASDTMKVVGIVDDQYVTMSHMMLVSRE